MNEHRFAHRAGPGITKESVIEFIPRLLGMLHVEMLVNGNATAAEVRPCQTIASLQYVCALSITRALLVIVSLHRHNLLTAHLNGP